MYCTPDALEAPLSTHIVAQHLPQAALLPPHLVRSLSRSLMSCHVSAPWDPVDAG